MKFKFYIFTLAGILLVATSCQTNSDNISTAEYDASSSLTTEKEDFRLERKALNKTGWFPSAYKEYQPNANAINTIRKRKDKLSFIVFGGSWCSDTKKALPKFYKVVETANIPAGKIALYGVDHDKNSLEKDGSKKQSKLYHIDRVPTFIVFYNSREIGRLNEKPLKSLEDDLAGLLDKY